MCPGLPTTNLILRIMASTKNLNAALLLVLFLSPSAWSKQIQWPYDLPEGTKYFPEDEPLVKRGLENMQRLQSEKPIGMKKMSSDPNEMFFMDYWIFDSDTTSHSLSPRSDQSSGGNTSWTPWPAIRPLLSEHQDFKFRRDLIEDLGYHSPLVKRFVCPDNYNNCTSVGQPDLCCATNSQCFKNGGGTVGCCPAGSTCGAGTNVGSCDTAAGYTPCKSSANGGCCIPNFSCYEQGCISVTTSTTTTTLPGATATACSSGYNTCAATLGGGCCPTSLACGTSQTCLTPSSPTTATAVVPPPVLPTAAGTSTVTAAPDTSAQAALPTIIVTSSRLYASCPNGYYFCSAYYRPGCCQVDRSCSSYDCPAYASSSTIISNGNTIVIPGGPLTGGSTYSAGAYITSTFTGFGQGACATSWTTCAQSLGGGCCSAGLACGSVNCGSAGNTANKIPPVGGGAPPGRQVDVLGWIFVGMGLVFGATMVLL